MQYSAHWFDVPDKEVQWAEILITSSAEEQL